MSTAGARYLRLAHFSWLLTSGIYHLKKRLPPKSLVSRGTTIRRGPVAGFDMMARPQADVQTIRAEILDHAETLLAESGGRRLVLADIAARMNRSQPYVHSYFANKKALVRALALRWFAQVEQEASVAASADGDWRARVRHYVLAIMDVKCAAYDRDPTLFRAYLALASGHGEVVHAHVQRLEDQLRTILSGSLLLEQIDPALRLILDTTVQFRVPHIIAQNREAATKQRANAVLDAVLDAITRTSD